MVVEKKVVAVTGANKGIGFETARRLVEHGCRVYLGSRQVAAGEAAARQIGAGFLQLDVTSKASVSNAVHAVAEAEGRLDVLINNAGISGPLGDAADYTAEEAAAVMSTNVVGYVRMIHACLPLLERSRDPRIVNVSSGLGSFGLFHDGSRLESRFGSPLYGASKAAINMLTARYARLLPNIRINAADPGMTATDLSHGQGQSVQDGTDVIVALATDGLGGVTGTFHDRDGVLPW